MILRHSVIISALVFGVFALGRPQVANACPATYGYPDYNCDGKFTISFFGDSVTRGISDPMINGVTGGVPLRVKQNFKQNLPKKTFKVLNFGHSGIKCLNLQIEARHRILKNEKGSADSDVAIYACGLNDFHTHKNPALTRAYLKAMKRFTKKRGIYSEVAKVTQTLRPWQQPWVAAVNNAIKNLGKRIRYDLIDPNIHVDNDLIHPNGAGYNFMFETFFTFLTSSEFIPLGENQLKLTDLDNDQLYDQFELSKFGTDPTIADTDGDGLLDGAEIFTHNTDPLNPDTDSDGASDGDEITNGSDPLVPDQV